MHAIDKQLGQGGGLARQGMLALTTKQAGGKCHEALYSGRAETSQPPKSRGLGPICLQVGTRTNDVGVL